MSKNIKKKPNRTNDVSVQFRCTKDLVRKINRNAKACKLSKSEYIRKLCELQEPKALPPEEFYQVKDLLEEFQRTYESDHGGIFDRGDLRRLGEAIEYFVDRVEKFYEDESDGDDKNMAD